MDFSPKKLKVLHVHDVAFVGSTLVAGLREIGVDARLYSFVNYANPRLPMLFSFFITLILRMLEVFRLGRYVRKEKFDIVHVHYGSFAYLALLDRILFFLHIHGTDVRRFIHWPILGNFIRLGMKKAQAVYYTTPDLKQLVEPYRPDAIFFPNPIDTDQFRPSEADKSPNQPTVFNINKIDRFKGLDIAFSGLELLWECMPKTRVVMFGFGNAMEEAKDFLERNMQTGRLELLPRVPHEKMVQLIQESTVILGQMSTGALGCSELEAMACGKPVVCNFSYAHMYPTSPPVINANTPEGAGEKLLYLVKNPVEAQAIGEEARKWVVENFDKRPIAEKLHEVYKLHLDQTGNFGHE